MPEETTQDQQAPTKEELMAFFQEQIDVKKLQVELQTLNTTLAKGRAEELQALQFIANMTNPNQQPTDRGKPHVITQEDLDANPELVEAGVKVGDEVLIPSNAPVEEKTSSRKLKK
jgi:hypothetical protein